MSNSRLNYTQLLRVFREGKWLFLGIPTVSILVAVAVIVFVPPEYEAVATLSPATGVWQGSSITGAGQVLARLTRASIVEGIPLYSAPALRAEAIGLLRSDALAEELIRQQHLLPVIGRAGWPANWRGPGTDTQASVSDAAEYFSKYIRTVRLDSRTGLVALTIRWTNATTAAKWADELIALTNAYCRARALVDARRNITYLNQQLRRTSDLDERNIIFELLRSQLDTEMVASGTSEYAFKIIDPPAVPVDPIFPRPLDVIAFGTLIGTMISIWLLLVRSARIRMEQRATVERSKRRLLPGHLNPKLIGLASLGGGALLTLYPPASYTALIDEQDLMFLNWKLLIFLGLCLGCFLFGSRLAAEITGNARPFVPYSPAEAQRRQRIAVRLAVIATVIAVVVAGIFVKDARGYLSALSHGGAQAIRAAALASLLNTGFAATNVLPLGFPLLLWAAGNIGIERSKTWFSARGVIYCALIVYGLCSIITLSRSLLMPYLLAVLVVLSGTRWNPRGIRTQKLLLAIAGLLTAVSGLFLLIAYFRSGAENSPLMMLAGYVPASYNRLAAALSGQLTPSISGVPYYSFRFLWYPPLLRRIVPMARIGRDFGWYIPSDNLTTLFAEFQQVASADMNPMFIWPTAFGYTFYDFGWWAPGYFIVVGFMAHALWRHFVARTEYGLILYSYFAASILLWSTDNFLGLPTLWVMVAVAVALRLWLGPRSILSSEPFPLKLEQAP